MAKAPGSPAGGGTHRGGSALVADEHLYLLNPANPDFVRIVADPPALFHFDPRLFR
jgi:hypothetical protein